MAALTVIPLDIEWELCKRNKGGNVMEQLKKQVLQKIRFRLNLLTHNYKPSVTLSQRKKIRWVWEWLLLRANQGHLWFHLIKRQRWFFCFSVAHVNCANLHALWLIAVERDRGATLYLYPFTWPCLYGYNHMFTGVRSEIDHGFSVAYDLTICPRSYLSVISVGLL